MKLITEGAKERNLPNEYRLYLDDIGSYTITTRGQRIGRFIFETLWLPFVMLIFALNRKLADKKGKSPQWLRLLTQGLFVAIWHSYDSFFKPVFGDGERTIESDGDDDQQHRSSVGKIVSHDASILA